MGVNNKLSGRIALDTTEYKLAITEANRDLRVLESGWKASAAGLGDWAKSATGVEGRIKTLNNEIDVQKTKVANTRAEYERMVQAHGEGSRAAEDMKIRLNNETASLSKMEGEVKKNTAALRDMNLVYKQAASAGFEFADIGTVATGILAGMVAVVAALVGGTALLVKTTIDWAQSLDSTMKLLNVTSGEAAGLRLLTDAVGVPIEDLTRGLDIMGKSLVTVDGKLGSTGKVLESIGINVYDVNGKLKSTPALLEEVANYMATMRDGTAKTALEMQLFGRSGAQMDEILRQAADGGMQRYIDQAQKMGLAMSKEQVDKVHNLSIDINKLKDQFIGIALALGINFIPLLQSLVTWLGLTVQGLQPAIQQMGDFLALLLGLPAIPSTTGAAAGPAPNWQTGDITGLTQDEINYLWVQYWRKKGPRPSGGTYTGGEGTAPATPAAAAETAPGFGGPGGEKPVLTLQPWQQALLDLKKTIVSDIWPLIQKIDWSKLLKGTTEGVNALLGGPSPSWGELPSTGAVDTTGAPKKYNWTSTGLTDKNGIQSEPGLVDWVADTVKLWVETGKAQLDVENFGRDIEDWWKRNVSGPVGELAWKNDSGIIDGWFTWWWTNIGTPILNLFTNIGPDWQASWQKAAVDWIRNNILNPLLDGSIWDFGDQWKESWQGKALDKLKTAFDQVGAIIGEAINSLKIKLAGMYNDVVAWINKLLGTKIPGISTGEKDFAGHAEGGKLDFRGWSVTGEKGYEVVGPGGFVFPHETSVEILKIFGGLRGFDGGGSLAGGIDVSGIFLIEALRQAQQLLAAAMGGFGRTAYAGAPAAASPILVGGGSSQAFSIYGPMNFNGNQEPGSLGDIILKDKRY